MSSLGCLAAMAATAAAAVAADELRCGLGGEITLNSTAYAPVCLHDELEAWHTLRGAHFSHTPTGLRGMAMAVPKQHVVPGDSHVHFTCPRDGEVCNAFTFVHNDTTCARPTGTAGVAAVLKHDWSELQCAPRFRLSAGSNTSHQMAGFVTQIAAGSTKSFRLPAAASFMAFGMAQCKMPMQCKALNASNCPAPAPPPRCPADFLSHRPL